MYKVNANSLQKIMIIAKVETGLKVLKGSRISSFIHGVIYSSHHQLLTMNFFEC